MLLSAAGRSDAKRSVIVSHTKHAAAQQRKRLVAACCIVLLTSPMRAAYNFMQACATTPLTSKPFSCFI